MINRWIVFSFVVASPLLVCAQTPTPPTQDQPSMQSPAEWQRKQDMAVKYPTLADFYAALKKEAASKRQSSAPPALPDWTGLWMAAGGGALFRPGPGGVAPKLTPAAIAEIKHGQELNAKGIVYDDNLSGCGPAGFPRWMQEPFLREFIPTPSQTLLITEQANEIRRIYTDGRDHPSEADQYPLSEGDSIGFWDGQKLVIHTNQLQTRSMGRNQPTQSDKMETVEIWERVDPNTILVDMWVFDPRLYLEPWYVARRYQQVPNPDKSLRIRYWDCSENPNNDVIKTEDGGTDFKGFTFNDKSNEKAKH
jgi:hypothetical protein